RARMQTVLQLELHDETRLYATSVFMVPAAWCDMVGRNLARHSELLAAQICEPTSGWRAQIKSHLRDWAAKRSRSKSLAQVGRLMEKARKEGAFVSSSLIFNLPVADPDCMAATGTWHGDQADKNISVISPITEFSPPVWLDHCEFKFFTTEFQVGKEFLASIKLMPLTANILSDAGAVYGETSEPA
ncbi:MAG: hypothetical protein ACKO0Z_09000, partial [Betaproteobacteria bacterium]